jgi:hypothetical protein
MLNIFCIYSFIFLISFTFYLKVDISTIFLMFASFVEILALQMNGDSSLLALSRMLCRSFFNCCFELQQRGVLSSLTIVSCCCCCCCAFAHLVCEGNSRIPRTRLPNTELYHVFLQIFSLSFSHSTYVILLMLPLQ